MAARKKRTARKKPATQLPPSRFRDRVTELRRVKASDLKKNSRNWRLHPDDQQGALNGLLNDVGFVGAVIARELEDGSLEIIDGHLRSDIAADEEIPVLVTDLNGEEAAKVLLTYDPLSQMAATDTEALSALLEDTDFGGGFDEDAYLRKLLTDLHTKLEKDEAAGVDLKESEREVPNMALTPHEHYDYILVLATTTHEWNVLCERLDLTPEKRRKRMGTGRAIHASKLLGKLKADD